MIRTLTLAALVLALATPALAGDFYKSTRRGHGSTSSHLSKQGIVGGRSVTSDYYRPYRHGYSYRRPHSERIIIIERDYGGRRWR
jgi:hypothetical protein